MYFDLTPKSGVYLNGFEVTQEVFSGSQELQAEFVAKQCEYAKGLVQAIMKNILVTQEHDSVVSRCTEQMFAQVFAQKWLKKQPTLLWLREEIGKELEQVDTPTMKLLSVPSITPWKSIPRVPAICWRTRPILNFRIDW